MLVDGAVSSIAGDNSDGVITEVASKKKTKFFLDEGSRHWRLDPGGTLWQNPHCRTQSEASLLQKVEHAGNLT